MIIDLSDRIALVTGSSRGIGRVIALALAEAGADICICGRDMELLRGVKKKIEGLGRKGYVIQADLTKTDGAQGLSRQLEDLGRLDILVNNLGGVPHFGRFEDLSDNDWREAFDVNLMSMVRTTRLAIPYLGKSSHGRIINISSVPARQPGAFNPHYSAMKTGIINISKHLANSLAQKKILVNTICPSTLTGGSWNENIIDRASHDSISIQEAEKNMIKEEAAKNPLGKVGTPRDVAHLVAFLSSDMASFITGTCINVDGGGQRSIF